MLKVADYLYRAAACRDLARTTASPNHRAELEKMAATWERACGAAKAAIEPQGWFGCRWQL